jgi:uncharacterized protein (DUF1501 family)
VLYLAGGQDGLNVIVPNSAADHAIYAKSRPVIGRIQGRSAGGRVGSLPIPATGGELAFASPTVSKAGGGDNGDPSYGFDELYGAGTGTAGSDLALLPATDYTPPNLSHFTSQDYWFAGALELLETGWLGRWLDLYGSSTNPLQAISIGTALSKALLSVRAPVCTISSLATSGFTFNAGGGARGGDPSGRGHRAARRGTGRRRRARAHARVLRARRRRAAEDKRARKAAARQRLPAELLAGTAAPARRRAPGCGLWDPGDHDQLGWV